ncbi:zinc-dependent metalloprotease [Sinomonas notoginsengisoli]|uniref:zinc-dependent metalloprotease n=1 Tax=Sinomonas notoginsengisoli TaxID=1457311 RepID=UPI001F3D7E2B|nr:zinc-dependent metalloprotease [Sinomonas notoginsengisoli]
MDAPQMASQLINWDLAASTAARLAPPGPAMRRPDAMEVVESLRRLADASVPHVHRITGLAVAEDLRDSQLLIVDRASWAKANAQGFEVMMGPVLTKLVEKKTSELTPTAARVGGAITGTQLGAILAYLASRVLGQYEPFAALAEGSTLPPAGRLLLVAPNIVHVERELGVDPEDFRMWVCLHEQTHRVQFAAAPWLRGHMIEQISKLSESLVGNMDSLMERATAAAKSLRDRTADSSDLPSKGAILDLLQDPEERAAISHLTAVMSLLEGHANVVMDAVDASVVPSVKTIRQRFQARNENRGPIEMFVRRLLGIEAKMRQYTDGQEFVRHVVEAVGMEGFNRVWEAAENLPTEEEIHDPAAWIARMGL